MHRRLLWIDAAVIMYPEPGDDGVVLHSVPRYGSRVEDVTENPTTEAGWVPTACTLPTADQPLRTVEFDALFREAVTTVDQRTPGELVLALRATAQNAARAARLAAMETGCCSFFRFDLTLADATAVLTVTTQPGHEQVLAALGARARSIVGAAA